MLAQEVRCGRQIRAAHRPFPCQAFRTVRDPPVQGPLADLCPANALEFLLQHFDLTQTRYLSHIHPHYRHHDYLQGVSQNAAASQLDAQFTACSRPAVEAKLTWPV